MRQEMAILYRSNAQSRVIESALFNAVEFRTACMAVCASSSDPEVKHALAYLRLLENPNDDTSCVSSTSGPGHQRQDAGDLAGPGQRPMGAASSRPWRPCRAERANLVAFADPDRLDPQA